jgi:glycosyltransferase involved in cell wall biosynthesis
MVSIYTLTYNEEIMIDFFINHYRNLFPECEIIIFDNKSTDKTTQIAKSKNCKIIQFDTNDQISDSKYLDIKNNCWKESKNNWVIVCDCDELIMINSQQLVEEEKNGTTLIDFIGYNMVNTSNNPNKISLNEIDSGVRASAYDKMVMFNKNKIQEINYLHGCHKANPLGEIKTSKNKYKLLHYKFISKKYIIDRYELFKKRLSEENILKKWGVHYLKEKDELSLIFDDIRKNSKKIYE